MTRRRSGHRLSRSREGSGLNYPTFPSRTRALLKRIHLRRPKRAKAIDEHRVARPAKTPEQWKHAPNRYDVKGVDLPSPREIHAHRSKIARATDEAKNAPTAKTPYQWMRHPERTDLKGIDKPVRAPKKNPYRLTPEQRKKMVTLISESQWTDPRIWSLQDGFGKVGYTPEDGHHDWSAIRDSSDQAVRAMYRAAKQMQGRATPKAKPKPRKHQERHEAQGKRVYPEVKNVSTLEDARRLIKLIEKDRIPKDLKRQRLQFMYALCYAKDFEKQFQDSITEARDLFHSAYTKYTKKEKAIGEGKPKPSPKAKPKPKVNLAELYKQYEPPDWVKDKAKYRDMWRHYVSECRKSGVGEDRYDFDQELYDDEISRDAIKEKIHKHVWGLAPEGRAQDEYLAQKYEEIVGIPRSEYEAMKMKLEQAEEATA